MCSSDLEKKNTGDRIQNTEYRIQDTGYRIQDTEYRTQEKLRHREFLDGIAILLIL